MSFFKKKNHELFLIPPAVAAGAAPRRVLATSEGMGRCAGHKETSRGCHRVAYRTSQVDTELEVAANRRHRSSVRCQPSEMPKNLQNDEFLTENHFPKWFPGTMPSPCSSSCEVWYTTMWHPHDVHLCPAHLGTSSHTLRTCQDSPGSRPDRHSGWD